MRHFVRLRRQRRCCRLIGSCVVGKRFLVLCRTEVRLYAKEEDDEPEDVFDLSEFAFSALKIRDGMNVATMEVSRSLLEAALFGTSRRTQRVSLAAVAGQDGIPLLRRQRLGERELGHRHPQPQADDR